MKIFLRGLVAWITATFFVGLEIIIGYSCFSILKSIPVLVGIDAVAAFLYLLINIFAFVIAGILMVLILTIVCEWVYDAF